MASSLPAHAKAFLCTYSWPGNAKSHSVLLQVDGQKATVRGGMLDLHFAVAADSPTELLLYQLFTKENAGANYPVGFSTMALDKKTRAFVYSNSFAGGDQNNHATGSCEDAMRDGA